MFNEHNPELAAEFVTPDVKWHGGTLGSIEGNDNLVALLHGSIGALPDLKRAGGSVVRGRLHRRGPVYRARLARPHGRPLHGVGQPTGSAGA